LYREIAMPTEAFLNILQMPNWVLRDHIENELLDNPVLEIEPSTDAFFLPGDDPREILQVPIQTLQGHIDEELADLVVQGSRRGELEVRVLGTEGTRLAISRRYVELDQDPAMDLPMRKYLWRKITQAKRLLKALEWRRAMLQKVAVVIFRQQRGFLEYGPDYIARLSEAQVASESGTQVATVRCAVENKQVRTPHGIILLESFIVRPSKADP
jgi:DNA-directed RNA polymerase specialized sigma54-like protein